jgi:farnesyl-diphosphate farnesyltransferase
MGSTNPRDVAYLCRDYARQIHAKATPADPNFIKLSITCGRIEQWCEHHYPSFISLVPGEGPKVKDTGEGRLRTMKRERELVLAQRHEATKQALGRDPSQQEPLPWAFLIFIFGAFLVVVLLSAAVVYGVLWYSDEL